MGSRPTFVMSTPSVNGSIRAKRHWLNFASDSLPCAPAVRQLWESKRIPSLQAPERLAMTGYFYYQLTSPQQRQCCLIKLPIFFEGTYMRNLLLVVIVFLNTFFIQGFSSTAQS